MNRVTVRLLTVPAALVIAGGALAGCGGGSTPSAGRQAAVAAHGSGGAVVLKPGKDYGDRYADGILPVGDGKYRTSSARKGYVFVCAQYAQSLSAGGGGAMVRGPWFIDNNKKYDVNQKIHVHGHVHWTSRLHIRVHGSHRIVTTNDLPRHHTGVFPIRSTDPAYAYDRNPNHIASQSITLRLARHPSYGKPQCEGGEVGVMNTGVMLFNAFDAGGRDAGAWEVQDGCDGHPQMSSEYHYHTLSSCIRNVGVHHVIGWALDGYPITGPVVGKHNVLTTRDLDVCHGLVSSVKIDGAKVRTYHYVMTQDFPYSVSCFRATPVTTGPA
ncbi:MAG TPA: YHYH protein [Mycobacteriales bacterium]|nr:YHYH protein [Mycobacteriales bacterium]